MKNRYYIVIIWLFGISTFSFGALVINFDHNIYDATKWEDTNIRYNFHRSIETFDREAIAVRNALKQLEQVSCLRFTEDSSIKFFSKDVLIFMKSTDRGCQSTVGRQRRENMVRGVSFCYSTPGYILHEVLHTLGFEHEHQREDRDQYITINYDGIRDGKSGNFNIARRPYVSTYGTPYDPYSVMHYHSRIFAKPGKTTMSPKQSWIDPRRLGQREGLSPKDIYAINMVYCKK